MCLSEHNILSVFANGGGLRSDPAAFLSRASASFAEYRAIRTDTSVEKPHDAGVFRTHRAGIVFANAAPICLKPCQGQLEGHTSLENPCEPFRTYDAGVLFANGGGCALPSPI